MYNKNAITLWQAAFLTLSVDSMTTSAKMV